VKGFHVAQSQMQIMKMEASLTVRQAITSISGERGFN